MKNKPYPKIKRMAGGIMPIPYPVESGKRFNWLVSVIKQCGYRIGAEVGVAGGRTTGTLLKACPDLHLYAVDFWAPIPNAMGGGIQYKDWNFKKMRRKFDAVINLFSDRVTVLQGISWLMARKVEDESLDFVFIDADHEYESVLKDIRAWTPKLKPGGMMSGHDTHFEGVLAAINELIPKWEATGVDHVWKCKKEDIRWRMISNTYKKLNEELHQSNDRFGNGGDKWMLQIQQLANKTHSTFILDYGCGKGMLIQALRKAGFNVEGYDPAVEEWDNYPIHEVDMVVCCDVLEHIEEEFLDATINKLRALSQKAFFAVIALRPSNKIFSNGKNTHITLLSSNEWMNRLCNCFDGGKRLRWNNSNKLLFQWVKK